MKKIILLLMFFLATIHNTTNAQIVISEVHYDTKFIEYMYHESLVNQKHHLGEYIELYNYTTEDIPLKGWMMGSINQNYVFPNNAVIKSGDFVIVAYGKATEPYFTQFYPTAVGHETKIYYQENVMLDNLEDNVTLLVGDIRGTSLNFGYNRQLADVVWKDRNFPDRNNSNNNDPIFQSVGDWDANFVFNSSTDYYNNSIHYKKNCIPTVNNISVTTDYLFDTASPFALIEPIPLVPLTNIPWIQDFYYQYYANLLWNEIVAPIKNKICPLAIPDIYQTDNNTYQTNGRCFTYDANGNNNGSIACTPPTITNTSPTNTYTDNEIATFDALIRVAPNPSVTGITTVYWSGAVTSKITNIIVANTSGQVLYTYTITNSQTSQTINLGMQTGIYIVRIQLDSSQFISRNIIKT